MRLADYLVFRTPPAHLGVQNAPVSGTIPASRVALSLIGLIIGIAASFVVTGIHPAGQHKASVPSVAAASPSRSTAETTPSTDAPSEPKVNLDLSGRRILIVGLISLVICGLTYQGLYFSLRLYENQPTILIFFVSFQYGYFWQSVVEGARTLLSAAQ
jgi:hypothetical protein